MSPSMPPEVIAGGRYVVRVLDGTADIAPVRALRALSFRTDAGAAADAWDLRCRHLVVQDADGLPVCTARLLTLASGAEIAGSYSAQFYALDALARFGRRMIEVGRFCIRPGRRDGDILRIAWGGLTRLVDDEGAGMLFGCASFRGTDGAAYADTFGLLGTRHRAPAHLAPAVKAARVLRFGDVGPADAVRALRAMPPLLRSYLAMGGWVSDHAVVDAEMDTLHVFTAVEIAAIPPARVRLLRAVAAMG